MSDLIIAVYPVGPLATNTYLVYDETTRKAVVIDPGLDCDVVLEAARDLHVEHILLTHAHYDHIGGVRPFKELTGAKVWIHELERSWLLDPVKNLSAVAQWNAEPVTAPDADEIWSGGERLNFLGMSVEVLFTPGHSPGHVSLKFGDVVFGGDALFAGSIGRTDLPGGNHQQLLESIRRELLSLPDETRVFPGHGPATTIGAERKSNPFLRTW